MTCQEQPFAGIATLQQQAWGVAMPRQRVVDAAVVEPPVSAVAKPSVLSADAVVELTIIVPTLNEHENVPELVRRLDQALTGYAWEVIFVDDDSRDGTADVVRALGQHDRRVRCLQRIGRRGLSTACMEGMLSSSAPYLAIIDADLQHDEKLLPRMLDILKHEDVDIVVGSRHIDGGSLGEWLQHRIHISQVATRISRAVLHAELTDPMSGFFMLKRQVLQQRVHHLSGFGFKLLLDIFATAGTPLRFKELPYRFRNRQFGDSKLDSRVMWDFLMLLLDKRIGHLIPARFVTFLLVGMIGVVVHLASVMALFKGLQLAFTPAQAGAAFIAMTSNFALNNVLTYRDVRLKGWRWLRGWFTFVIACSVGALANVGIASILFRTQTSWWLAATAGILIGAVWNYALTSIYTWQNR